MSALIDNLEYIEELLDNLILNHYVYDYEKVVEPATEPVTFSEELEGLEDIKNPGQYDVDRITGEVYYTNQFVDMITNAYENIKLGEGIETLDELDFWDGDTNMRTKKLCIRIDKKLERINSYNGDKLLKYMKGQHGNVDMYDEIDEYEDSDYDYNDPDCYVEGETGDEEDDLYLDSDFDIEEKDNSVRSKNEPFAYYNGKIYHGKDKVEMIEQFKEEDRKMRPWKIGTYIALAVVYVICMIFLIKCL